MTEQIKTQAHTWASLGVMRGNGAVGLKMDFDAVALPPGYKLQQILNEEMPAEIYLESDKQIEVWSMGIYNNHGMMTAYPHALIDQMPLSDTIIRTEKLKPPIPTPEEKPKAKPHTRTRKRGKIKKR